MTQVALSIVMPVYNAEKYIQQAVTSLLEQSYRDFELIVVNDGSTDKSMEIIQGFNDERIRILHNDKNRGIVYSRNRGNAAARGRYLAPFDADDVARADKFEKQLAFLEAHPEYGMIGSWARLIDARGHVMRQKWKVNAPPERIPSILLFRNYFVQSSVVIRREAIPEEGYAEGYDAVEDYRMWGLVARRYKVWNYPAYLLQYRIHEQGITKRESDQMAGRDAKVFPLLYEPFHIQLNKRNLQLLQTLKDNRPITDLQDLNDLEVFFLHLLSQNKKHQVVDQKQLLSVVTTRWIKACWLARGLKHRALLTFLRSSFLTSRL